MKGWFARERFSFITSSIILVGIIADQLTKLLTTLYLPKQFDSFYEDPLQVIPKFFFLVEHHNEGVAWSQFEGVFFVLYIVPIFALAMFFYLLYKGNLKTMKTYSIGLSLMIAGTIGNLLDRIFLGYVIDFLSFTFGTYVYPTFNLADSSLVIGVALFCIDILFLEPKRTQKLKGLKNEL
jgi:signal peptidase II